MNLNKLDKINIRDLQAQCILGVYEEERHAKRPVIINYSIFYKGRQFRGDNIRETLDYDVISQNLIQAVEQTSFKFIETLAEFIAEKILSFPGVMACKVMVDKPGVPNRARSAGVEILRGI